MVEDICFEKEILSGSILPKNKVEILRQFNNYIKSGFSKAVNAKHEVPFILSLKDFYIEGKIDKLIMNDKGWTIVDFKTGSANKTKEEIEKEYKIQMDTYALAVAKASVKKDGRVVLLLLSHEDPLEISTDFSEKDISRTENDLIKMMVDISEAKFEATESNACEWCSHKNLCQRVKRT